MRRLTALALVVLIALAIPVQFAGATHRQSSPAAPGGGMAGGGLASDRPADAAFVRPEATVVTTIAAASQIPSIGPDARCTALLLDLRPQPGRSRQFRSFPLLI